MCASDFSLRAEGLNCESSSSLSSPSAEFSGKHLTPARFPQPCLLLLAVRRGRGGTTGTKVAVSNCGLPNANLCSPFSPTGKCHTDRQLFHFCINPSSIYFVIDLKFALKRHSKRCFLGLKQTAGQTTLFRLSELLENAPQILSPLLQSVKILNCDSCSNSQV